MTSNQSTQLDQAYNDYISKKQAYDSVAAEYATAANTPMPQYAYNSIVPPLKARTEAAKVAMDNALMAYNTLKDTIASQDQAAFLAANPTVAISIAQAQAAANVKAVEAQADAALKAKELAAKTEMEAANSTFVQQNKKAILYVSIALVLIIVVTWTIFKFKKKQP